MLHATCQADCLEYFSLFSGILTSPLSSRSVLVLNGNGADVAKHCVPAVPTKRYKRFWFYLLGISWLDCFTPFISSFPGYPSRLGRWMNLKGPKIMFQNLTCWEFSHCSMKWKDPRGWIHIKQTGIQEGIRLGERLTMARGDTRREMTHVQSLTIHFKFTEGLQVDEGSG